MPNGLRLSLAFLACNAILGCSREAVSAVYPAVDLKPPGLVAAGPTDSKSFLLRFDEAICQVAGSLAVEPRCEISGGVEGETLHVSFEAAQSPGADYAIAGEVDDLRGNRTRFLVRFVGWNDRVPALRISEVQTGKNDSKSNPHRDFIELAILSEGNLGGVELSWTSSVKSATYRFPGVEVRGGEFAVLHLSPENLASELDEIGLDLSASGGVDARPTGRDFWCGTMALPDSSGIIALARRPGAAPSDGLFYAEEGKSGQMVEGKLADALSDLAGAGVWPLVGQKPAWEDGVRWKASGSRSLCRSGPVAGASSWYVGAAGTQSPGAANGGSETSSRAIKSNAKAIKAKKAGNKGP